MVKSTMILAVISVLVATSAGAFETKTGEIWVFNSTSCGQYNQDRKFPGSNSADKLFVAGWLSAYNVRDEIAVVIGSFPKMRL